MAHEHHVFPQHAKDAFTHDALERISKTIAEVEEGTRAEIRIAIRDMRDASESGLSLPDLALKEFMHLGMQNTTDRTGILLFILYDERKFYVFGDEGVHKRSDPDTWTDVAETLKRHFKEGKFEEGVHEALRCIHSHVDKDLPDAGHNPHELSNQVVID